MVRPVFVAAALLAAFPVAGDGARPVRDASVMEQERALAAARRTALLAERRSSVLEAHAKNMARAADRSQAEQVAAAAAIQASEARIDAATEQVRLIDRLRSVQRARLAEKQGPIIRLTAALQTMARRPTALALIQPGSVNDMIHVRALLGATLPVIRTRTAGLRAEVAHGDALRRQADLAVIALRHEQRQLEIRQTALARLEVDQRRKSQDYVDSAMIEQDRTIALGEEVKDIAQLIADLGDQANISARLAALPGPVLRPAVPGQMPAPLPIIVDEQRADRPPSYRMPVIGRLVAGLGEVSDSGVRAKGVTLQTSRGAQVVSPADGRVAFAGPFRGYAAIVIIDHDKGWTTLITGMRSLNVRPGESVAQGSPIGIADGASPKVTVELRHAGQPVDILPITTQS
jgi:septal ring factor EnvC (AmiA/AmiB activator)